MIFCKINNGSVNCLVVISLFSFQPGNSSVAARIAVGESQIVSEIKEFLLENGVALDSFGQVNTSSAIFQSHSDLNRTGQKFLLYFV